MEQYAFPIAEAKNIVRHDDFFRQLNIKFDQQKVSILSTPKIIRVAAKFALAKQQTIFVKPESNKPHKPFEFSDAIREDIMQIFMQEVKRRHFFDKDAQDESWSVIDIEAVYGDLVTTTIRVLEHRVMERFSDVLAQGKSAHNKRPSDAVHYEFSIEKAEEIFPFLEFLNELKQELPKKTGAHTYDGVLKALTAFVRKKGENDVLLRSVRHETSAIVKNVVLPGDMESLIKIIMDRLENMLKRHFEIQKGKRGRLGKHIIAREFPDVLYKDFYTEVAKAIEVFVSDTLWGLGFIAKKVGYERIPMALQPFLPVKA